MNFSMNISAVYGYKNMVKIYYTLELYTHLGAIKNTYSTPPTTIFIRPCLSLSKFTEYDTLTEMKEQVKAPIEKVELRRGKSKDHQTNNKNE
jgi:hypothetical protein